MKQKTLHVENFGPISDATVELRAINMFIGEQSIGKSTLAKLITIFTDYQSLGKLILEETETWKSQLKEYNLDIYISDCYHITFDMSNDDDNRFHIELKPGDISYSMKYMGREITDKNEIAIRIFQLKRFYHEKNSIKSVKEEFQRDKVNDELYINSLYIPAERIIYSVLPNLMPALTLAGSSVPKNLLRFMVEFNNAKAEYPKINLPLLNIVFKHESSEDSIVVNNGEKDIPMPAASSGIQSLVPLLLVLKYATEKREYSSFVIEEPECNLFPTKQVDLLKEIIGLVKHPTRTLTITTHSPYLLSAMNNILFAGRLIEKYGKGIKKYVNGIVPEALQLNMCDCSVYSLGKDINGGEYCRSLIDEGTGMIDFNSLDAVSEILGNEFDELQRAVMKYMRDK